LKTGVAQTTVAEQCVTKTFLAALFRVQNRAQPGWKYVPLSTTISLRDIPKEGRKGRNEKMTKILLKKKKENTTCGGMRSTQKAEER
jgi:hypothetical protein